MILLSQDYGPKLYPLLLYNLTFMLHVSVSFGIQSMLLYVLFMDIDKNGVHNDCYVNIKTHSIAQKHVRKCFHAMNYLLIYAPQTQNYYNTHISEIIHQLKHSKNIDTTIQYDTL